MLHKNVLCITSGHCSEHAIAWQGNQKPRAALVKTGHRVQAMKQAVPIIERVNAEILGNKINNLN